MATLSLLGLLHFTELIDEKIIMFLRNRITKRTNALYVIHFLKSLHFHLLLGIKYTFEKNLTLMLIRGWKVEWNHHNSCRKHSSIFLWWKVHLCLLAIQTDEANQLLLLTVKRKRKNLRWVRKHNIQNKQAVWKTSYCLSPEMTYSCFFKLNNLFYSYSCLFCLQWLWTKLNETSVVKSPDT